MTEKVNKMLKIYTISEQILACLLHTISPASLPYGGCRSRDLLHPSRDCMDSPHYFINPLRFPPFTFLILTYFRRCCGRKNAAAGSSNVGLFFCTRTEGKIKVCTWLREISSCSCLTVLPGPAWVLLSKKYILFPGAL